MDDDPPCIFPERWRPDPEAGRLCWGWRPATPPPDIERAPFVLTLEGGDRWEGEALLCPVDGLIAAHLRPAPRTDARERVAELLALTAPLDPEDVALDDLGLTVVRTDVAIVTFDTLDGLVSLAPATP